MEASPVPFLLVELLLVAGGVGAFCWWQLRSVRRDQEKSRRAREAADAAAGKAPDQGKNG